MTRQRDEIDQLLSRLKGAIRRYLLLEGLAVLLALACGAFWVTYGVDWLHFQWSRLELPQWFRATCAVTIGGLLAGAAVSWLSRLMRGLRSPALALVLERRFPQLNDRLITAVELADQHRVRHDDEALHAEMVARTAEEAAALTRTLDVDSVFDNAPLRRMLTMAVMLLASVTMLGVVDAQAMHRWVQAYLLGRDDYWSPFRQHQLEVRAITQPGDRVREFAPDGTLKHPRGARLELQVLSAEGRLPPDEVSLQAISYGGGGIERTRVQMQRSGDREFRHRFDSVIHDTQLKVTGGDFTNRLPLRVLIVDPPRVDRLSLLCDYPSYTGWDSREDQRVEVASTQVSLPMETRFELIGEVNKPLRQVHLRSGRFDISFSAAGTPSEGLRLTIRDRETDVPHSVTVSAPETPLISAERTGFRIPLWISASADDRLDAFPPSGEFPIPVPSGSALQIYLEDEDEIYSPDPAMFVLHGIPDLPPVVDTKLRGVRNKVTRMASIPIDGRITDDYGVVRAWFSYQSDQHSEPQELAVHLPPAGRKEVPLQASASDSVERFSLLPLELSEGQTLTLAVQAEDGDVLNGPHRGRGQPFQFTIVSNDELLALLYDDEINLRLRFEHIYDEVKQLHDEFVAYEQRLQMPMSGEGAGGGAAPAPPSSTGAFAERSLHQLRKNHTESRAIEISFREMREEMVNNRIDTRELIVRIEDGVLRPLQRLNEQEFTIADERLGAFRLIAERGGSVSEPAAACIGSLKVLLARMDAILAEMRDRSSYNQLIQQLQQLIELQQQLMEQTQEKGLEEKFFQLGN